MDNIDLCEVQGAITKMILRTDPDFLVRIERTFIFEVKCWWYARMRRARRQDNVTGGQI